MLSLFSTYMELGFKHISDPKAYDHIVFIIALCAIYRLSEWKKVAILVTAFTIGHSITLALAALEIITFPGHIIEMLIPITILITCLYNVVFKKEKLEVDNIFKKKTTEEESIFNRQLSINYLFALFFGLIHGMGFSNFFRSLHGDESSIIKPLFAFNIGLELGQLLIVIKILVWSYFAMEIFKVKQREWNLFVSGAAAGIAITLLIGLFE